jgi:hypothetical protein
VKVTDHLLIITGDYFAFESHQLKEANKIKRKRKQRIRYLLLQVNVSVQKAEVDVEVNCGFQQLPCIPYSPDMALTFSKSEIRNA